MRQPKQRISAQGLDLKDQVISINRVTKVVKGGKNMSFAALVVVGDEGGHVGFGTGKAREVPLAIKKAIEAAKKSLIRVPLIKNTVPHQLIGKFGAGRVLVKPASEGTGVIAGGAVRAGDAGCRACMTCARKSWVPPIRTTLCAPLLTRCCG